MKKILIGTLVILIIGLIGFLLSKNANIQLFDREFSFEEYPIKFTYNSDWIVKSNSPENVTLQKDDYVFTLNTEQRGIGFEEPEPIVTENFIQKDGKDIIINGNPIKRLNVYYPNTNEYSYLINIHYSDSAARMYSVLINYSSKDNSEVPQQVLKELDSIVTSLKVG